MKTIVCCIGVYLMSMSLYAGNTQQFPSVVVFPGYPADMGLKGISGVVKLKAIISASGDVEKVDLISGNKELSIVAVHALKKWKYKKSSEEEVVFEFRLGMPKNESCPIEFKLPNRVILYHPVVELPANDNSK